MPGHYSVPGLTMQKMDIWGYYLSLIRYSHTSCVLTRARLNIKINLLFTHILCSNPELV